MPDDPYSLGDLARLADVTPRTVRYYIAQGLLPSPDAAGPATRYTDGHLARLRLIKRLQRDHLPLAEIRARLERMADEDVLAAAASLDPVAPDPSLDQQDTLDFVRSLMLQAGIRPSVAEVPSEALPAPTRHRPSLLRRIEAAIPAPSGPARSAAFDMGRAPAPVTPAPAVPVPPAMRRPASESSASSPAASSVQPAPSEPPAMAPSASLAEGAAGEPLASTAIDTPAPAPPSRTAPDRTTWERLAISPDVELHVRRPLDRQTNKRVDQLERIARELFEDP